MTPERRLEVIEANDVVGGDYIFHTDVATTDRGRVSWQCGRGADSLAFWALWKNNGAEGLGTFVDRLFTLRDEAVRWIQQQPRLELVSNPTYLNICVRILPPDTADFDAHWSRKAREELIADNCAMVNFARDSKGSFLRLILDRIHLP